MKSVEDKFNLDYPVIIELPVQWGDMDAFNHVNNVIYFRYFESARMALFWRTSMMETMSISDIGPILAETQCRYRKAVTYPDRIRVGTRVNDITEFGFTQEYAIFSTEQHDITTLATSRVTMFDYNAGTRAHITEDLRAELQQLQIHHD